MEAARGPAGAGAPPGTTWRLRLAGGVPRAAVLEAIEADALAGRRMGHLVALDGVRAYLKGGPLDGRVRVRHGLRRLAGRPLPRLAEFENLEWLRAHGFEAPVPLAAGSLEGPWGPTWQFLATEVVEGAPTLREFLDRDPGRAAELFGLAVRTAARLHAAGFVHRDLYPRNLLVRRSHGDPRLVLLDAWRGGARRQLRGPAHDLACLLLHAPGWLSPAETAELLAEYAAGREAAGAPVRTQDLRAAVDRERERERRRLQRDPRRLRGLAMPPRAW
jgi:tRNA A-37 threonylcarbamoyl transferase component Bud32